MKGRILVGLTFEPRMHNSMGKDACEDEHINFKMPLELLHSLSYRLMAI